MRAVMSRRTQTPLPPTEVTPEHFFRTSRATLLGAPPGCVNTGVHARMLDAHGLASYLRQPVQLAMAWIEIERRVDAERDRETIHLQNFVEACSRAFHVT